MEISDVDGFLAHLAQVDRMLLVELAEQGRGLTPPPTFRGRCLDPAYLEAVASGAWSGEDEDLLARCEDGLTVLALSRVRLLDRRGLRAVLQGVALALLTGHLDVPGWAQRRQQLAEPWERLVAPLGTPVQRAAQLS